MYLKLLEQEDKESRGGVVISSIGYLEDRLSIGDNQRLRQSYLKRIRDAMKESLGGEFGEKTYRAFLEFAPNFSDEDLEMAGHAFLAAEQLSLEDKEMRNGIIADTVITQLWPLDDDDDDIVTRLQGFTRGMQRISFIFPTSSLADETKAVIGRLLAKAWEEAHLEYSNDPGIFKVYAKRKSLFMNAFRAVAGNDKDNSALASHVRQTVLNLLPHNMIIEAGSAVGMIAVQEDLYQSRISYLKDEIPSEGWFSYAKASVKALGVMPQGTEEDFKKSVAELKASATGDYDHHYADRLRVIHWMIRTKKPTPIIAKKQADILEKSRAKASEEVNNKIGKIFNELEQQTQEEIALFEIRWNEEITRLLTEAPFVITKIPTKQGSKGRGKSGKRGRGGGRGRGRGRGIDQTKPTISKKTLSKKTNSQLEELVQRRQNLRRYLQSLIEDCKDLEQGISSIEDQTSVAQLRELVAAVRLRLDMFPLNKDFVIEEGTELARQATDEITTHSVSLRQLLQRQTDFSGFEEALRIAIARERLTYGRQAGGVIGRNLGTLQWQEIFGRYHGRYQDGIACIWMGDQQRFLCDDEALALYVTRASLSGYDFDISVHLWRRRQGRTTVAVDNEGFMNTVDWYDTRVPCLVLHVPH